MSYKCPVCAKRYKSKSGLLRHRKAQHNLMADRDAIAPKAERHEEPVADDQDAADLMAERDPVQDARSKSDDDDAMIKACKALAIKPENVFEYKVYPDKVVIIEEPKRWKKTWYRKES